MPYDDSRQTFDIKDRYVIQPQFPLWSSGEELKTAYKHYVDNMQPVSEEFSYSSDQNSEWLTIEQLNAILTGK